MSYILDALKKLEHEKHKKSATGVTLIAGDLLRDERPYRGSGAGWKLVALVLIASVGTFGITWLYLRGNSRPAPATSPKAAQAVALPIAPAPPAPVPAPQNATQETNVMRAPSPMSAQVAAPAGSTSVDTSPRSKARVPDQKHVLPAAVQERLAPSAQQVSPPADVKVTGIAWQDERSARRAVVNGALLHEGSVVGAAKITEIFPDRVRFSNSGRVYDVSLISSGAMVSPK